jgi:hypothetical protein
MTGTQQFILELFGKCTEFVNSHGFIALLAAFGIGLHIPNTILPYMKKEEKKDAA